MRGATPEHTVTLNATSDPEVGTRPLDQPAELEALTRMNGERPVHRHGLPLTRHLEQRAGNRHRGLRLDQQFGANQRDLERGGLGSVANELVRETV